MALYNKQDKKLLKVKILQENRQRITASFYRYVRIEQPEILRDELYRKWERMQVMGRIYLAREGINAQISIPAPEWDLFIQSLYTYEEFNNVPVKTAVEDDNTAFYKLKIKVRNKIVADGLQESDFDVTNIGQHLSAKEFNEAMNLPGTIVVDMRNHYESEIGHFRNAIRPDADTFREELPLVRDLLKGKEHQKVLMYCTGGIRCEKASAYLNHHGFTDVNQLYGGIIHYVKQVKEEGLECNFIGKNFVFDERLGERITGDIIAQCHQCGNPCDNHTNCQNDDCHLLFIQCPQCAEKHQGCCSYNCMEIFKLPVEDQRKLRKGKIKKNAPAVFRKGRFSLQTNSMDRKPVP